MSRDEHVNVFDNIQSIRDDRQHYKGGDFKPFKRILDPVDDGSRKLLFPNRLQIDNKYRRRGSERPSSNLATFLLLILD